MKTFDTVAKLKLAKLKEGQFVDTGGYAAKGGGGLDKYFIKTAAQAATDGDVIDEIINHTLANTNVAILQRKLATDTKSSGDTGTGSAGDIAAVKQVILTTDRITDARSATAIAVRPLQGGADIEMEDITWPLQANVDYQGATGENCKWINYISPAQQVISVLTSPGDDWAPLTEYTLGIRKLNGVQAYKVTASGTSAASGGPTGTGTGIVDGTVTWKSINNGLNAGVPVNEWRIHTPYHPGLILDQKSPASFGGVNQDAHDFIDAFEAAGGDTSGEFKSIIWSQDGDAEWQLVGDSISDSLSLHKRSGTDQLWRMHFNSANGDLQLQHHDSNDIGNSKPIDCAGGMRVFTDTSTDSTVRSDNKSRFTVPEFSLRFRDNTGSDNNHKMSLAGSNGFQWLFDAADETGLNGEAQSSFRWNAYKSDAAQTSITLSGFFKSFYPVVANVTDLGRSGIAWLNGYIKNLRPGDGTVTWTSGVGDPQSVVSAAVGSLWTRTDGGTSTTLYVKETGGGGNTGWVAK